MKATLHRAKRYIVCDDDFLQLADKRLAGAMVLRVSEVKTDELIDYYREMWPDMPEDTFPGDEYLWFDADYKTFSTWTLHIRCRTMLVEMLCNGKKHTGLLIQKGYLKSRWVYYEDPEHRTETKNSAVRSTSRGRAYVVTDEQGNYYVEGENEPHSAPKDGFVYRRRQWLYCIDAINAAIAKLNGDIAEPVQRWKPEEAAMGNNGDARTKQRLTTTTTPGAAPSNTSLPTAQGGSSNTEEKREVFAEIQSSITDSAMQYLSASLLKAPLTGETIIALARAIPGLTVPRREEVDDLTWQREVQRPAEQLLRLPKVMQWLASGDDARAWQVIEGPLRYIATPGSPSWWQSERTRNTPITLRHAAKAFAVQQRDMEDKVKQHLWSPPDALPYTGPSMDHLFTWPDMAYDVAVALYDAIRTAHPSLILAYGEQPDYPGRFVVGVEYAPGQYLDFHAPDEWHGRGPEIEEKIQMGLAFAEALAEMNEESNQESQGPPGNN